MPPYPLVKTIALELNYNLLIFTALFYTLGILSPPWLIFPSLIALAVLGLVLVHLRSWVQIIILGVFLCSGHNNYQQTTSLPKDPNHIFYHIPSPKEAVITGRLATMVRFDGTFSRLLIDSEQISFSDSGGFFNKTTGLISLSVKSGDIPFIPGQNLMLRAKLKRPISFLGEGVFDYARFLAQKDIWVTGYIPTVAYIQTINDQNPPPILQQIGYRVEQARSYLGNFLDTRSSQSGLYRALLLGDKSRLSHKTLQNFQKCGLAHILAISGLHIAVLSSAIYFVLLFLLKRSTRILLATNVYKLALILTLPIIMMYATLTGMQAPVSRALLMFSLVVIATCIERVKTPMVLIVASGFLLLILDPRLLFQASFLLSYSAIIGITVSAPLLQRILVQTKNKSLPHRIGGSVLIMLVVSVVASFATLPVSLTFFNRTSLIGPLANVVVEPLLCLFTLPLGFMALCVLPFSDNLATILLNLGAGSIAVTKHLVHFGAELPFSHKWLPQPHPLLSFSFSISFCFLLHALYYKKWRKTCFSFWAIALTLLWVSPYEISKKYHSNNEVTIIDVGKGSANLIELEGGYRILIDGGGPKFTKGSVGQRVLAPLLWKKGIQKIDAVYLSHGDADHYNGLPFIIKHFGVQKLFVASRTYYNVNFRNFIEEIEALGVEVQVLTRGAEQIYGKGRLLCIENFAVSHPQPHTRNKGIVVGLNIRGKTILFPGDIHSGEENIIARYPQIQNDGLVASHHGSKTSSSNIFLNAVQASFILISANNSPYFPAPSVEARYKRHGIPYFSTAKHGSLSLKFTEDGLLLQGLPQRPTNPLTRKSTTTLFPSPIKNEKANKQ